jgi:hypothetical protein
VSGPQIRARSRRDIARQRRARGHPCWDHLIAAPLWPLHGVNLGTLPAARERTIAVLGHEQTGIPPEAIELLDVAVEIPMVGTGASLNVAVAGSLVLYRLAGFL